MGKPFMSSQLELARNRQRDSLDIFGQTSQLLLQHRAPGSQANVPLFSKVPGSAWDDALKAAERLLEGKDITFPSVPPSSSSSSSARPSNASRADRRSSSDRGGGHVSPAAVQKPQAVEEEERPPEKSSLNDLIGALEAAEKDPMESSKKWAGVMREAAVDHHEVPEQRQPPSSSSSSSYLHQYEEQRHQQRRESSSDAFERSRRSSAESESSTVRSAVSEDVINERAAQWGYGVVLKSSSKESTPRTSGGSFSSIGASSTMAVPAVSRDVKDALSSFVLAFLVCDATEPGFPILYASAGFTTMTGYSTEEIVGKNCRFLQGPDTDQATVDNVREALNNGQLFTGTLLNYKKDGTPFWNLLTLSPIKDDDGKIIKYIGMQAEQNSKEAQPRNSKGQKSPAIRAVRGPSSAQNGVKEQLPADDGAFSTSSQRHSSSSIPKPPLPQKTSPAIAPPERRRTSGPELRTVEDQTRRMSHRYSLTSNPVRSTRNSSVEEFQSPLYRRESRLRDRELVVDYGKSSSSFEGPETIAKAHSPSSVTSSEKNKGTRLTARILRLFRKDSKESKRRSEAAARGKEVMELSDSEDDRIDYFTTSSARSSGSRRHSSVGLQSTIRTSSQTRSEASTDDLTERLARMHINGGYHQRMSSATSSAATRSFDGSQQQFCIVESSSPRPPVAFNGNKEQFCVVESSASSPRAPPFERNMQQFCIVEPSSSSARVPSFEPKKQQFCIVEPSSPPLPYDAAKKQQFCIVRP